MHICELKAFPVFSLPVDVTTAAFMIGARTPEGWDFLFEKYRTSLQMSVKSRIKSAMAFSPLQDKLKWWVHYITPPTPSSLISATDFIITFSLFLSFYYPLSSCFPLYFTLPFPLLLFLSAG